MATRVNLIQVNKYVNHHVLNSNYVKKCSNKKNGSFLAIQIGAMSLCQWDIGFSHTPNNNSTDSHPLWNIDMSVSSNITMRDESITMRKKSHGTKLTCSNNDFVTILL